MATVIENLIIRTTTYHALVEFFEKFRVEEVEITNINIDELQLKEVYFHKDAVLIMINRDDNFSYSTWRHIFQEWRYTSCIRYSNNF